LTTGADQGHFLETSMAGGFGNVYVFNLYVEDIISFTLNGQNSAGKIVCPSAVTTKTPYSPQQLPVSRTNLNKSQLNSSLFVQGNNSMTVDYLGQSWTATVTIPVQPALQLDLWLYVAYQQAWLFDTSGDLLQTIQYEEARFAETDGRIIIKLGSGYRRDNR